VNSLCESYGQDEINQALDVVNLDAKTEDTSEFDRMVRERKDLEDRLKQSIKQRAEDELRAQRSRMTFDQLLQTIDNSDPREEEIKQAEALKKFVETKGYGDQHGEGFLAVLKQTQSYLGPYSLKMAHDYLRKVETSKKQ
jgi:soluble cytochrome b562